MSWKAVFENPNEIHFKRGDKLNIRAHRSEPGKGLTYPAMIVTASEDGRGGQYGGWDVYDGVTDFDEEVSFYGFSVESKVARRPRRENPINRDRIQEALSYVHYWEKNGETRAQAARDAARLRGLNDAETDILLNALHVKRSEIR